jgi:hypothetical protein
LLQNLNKIVERDILIVAVPQLERIFSILHKHLRAWLNKVGLGANKIRAERYVEKP